MDPFTSPANSLIDIPEAQLIGWLLHEVRTLYEFFNFVVEPALGPPPRRGWDYFFLAGLPREIFGLERGRQPGDIDVLIVPVLDNVPAVDLCCAIEVKRLALRGPNWSKNTDRYGVTQAHGLLNDDFPFVGILHLVVANLGPSGNHKDVEQWRVVDDYGRAERIGPTTVDMTASMAAERQLARLARQPIRPEVGLNCVAISSAEGAQRRLWSSVGPAGVRYAQRNPTVSARTLMNMQELLTTYGTRIKPRLVDRKDQRVGT